MKFLRNVTLAGVAFMPVAAWGGTVPARAPTKPLTLALAAPSPAGMRPTPSAAPLSVREIKLEGLEDGQRPLFDQIVASAGDRAYNRSELAALTAQIADLAREKGFVFATALIPRQDVRDGKLRIRIDMGRIDEIRLTGAANAEVARILEPLQDRVGTLGMIERKLLIARDVPGVSLGQPKFIREGDRNVLVIAVAQNRYALSGSIDNYGTHAFGPARARLGVQANSLLVSGDSVAFGLRTNPADPGEIFQGFGSYSVPIGNDGLQIGVAGSIGDSAPGEFGAGRLKGRSYYGAAFASYPLVRSEKASLWLNAEAAYLALDSRFLGIAISDDTEVALTVGLGARVAVGKGVLRATLDLVQGIDALGATRDGNPIASLSDGDAVFTKGTTAVSFDLPLTRSVSMLVSASGQIASRPLLAAQELSVGGAYSVRGYDFAETSGEDGAVGLLELRKDWSKPFKGVDRLQAYAFVDAARVADLRSDYTKTLASVGPGVRARFGPVEIEAEVGFPLTGPRLATGNKHPRLNLNLSFGF